MKINQLEQDVLCKVLDDDYLSCNHEYFLTYFVQQFYKFKLIICILLGLYVSNPKEDGLTVMCVNYRSWYYGWNADFVAVGLGFFSGWAYTFYEDGDHAI